MSDTFCQIFRQFVVWATHHCKRHLKASMLRQVPRQAELKLVSPKLKKTVEANRDFNLLLYFSPFSPFLTRLGISLE